MSQTVLKKLNSIECDLQMVKAELFLRAKVQKQPSGIYREEDILKEVRAARKQLWNERYTKKI